MYLWSDSGVDRGSALAWLSVPAVPIYLRGYPSLNANFRICTEHARLDGMFSVIACCLLLWAGLRILHVQYAGSGASMVARSLFSPLRCCGAVDLRQLSVCYWRVPLVWGSVSPVRVGVLDVQYGNGLGVQIMR